MLYYTISTRTKRFTEYYKKISNIFILDEFAERILMNKIDTGQGQLQKLT